MLRRRTFAIACFLALAAATVAGWFEPISNGITARHFLAAPRAPTGQVVVVDIDGQSLADVGVWPWPRRIHGEILDRLTAMGAGQIALDIDFSSRSTPAEDAALLAALDRSGGGVLLAALRQFPQAGAESSRLTLPLPEFAEVGWPALVDVQPDRDGRVRRITTGATIDGVAYLSIPVELAGGTARPNTAIEIDFSIDPKSIDRISVSDLLAGRVAAERVAGKSVIVGATAVELGDRVMVPAHGSIPGPLFLAVATETILQNRSLTHSGLPPTLIALLMLALATAAAGDRRLPLIVLLPGLAVFAMATEAATLWLQSGPGVVFDSAPVLLGAAVFGVLGLARETDLRRLLLLKARAEADDLRSLLSRVIEDSLTGVLVADRDGVILAASRETSRMLGLGTVDLVGRRLEDCVPPRVMDRATEVLRAHDLGLDPDGAAVDVHLSEDGPDRVLACAVTPSVAPPRPGAAPDVCLCVMMQDVTADRLAAEQEARRLRTDPLTSAANRFGLTERLDEALAGPDGAGVIVLDIDRFGELNDSFGMAFGDRVLAGLARRFAACAEPGETFGRLHGDRFALLLPGPCDDKRLFGRGRALIEMAAEPFAHGDHSLSVTLSVGVVAVAPGTGADEALQRADTARSAAKGDGGGRVRVYDQAFDTAVRARRLLEADLAGALERGEFHVVYQPQVELATGRLSGVEALVRWTHPERGAVSPAEFIPVVERIGLIPGLGDWVLREACREVASWPLPLKVAVNLSPLQFEQRDLVQRVFSAVAASGLPPTRLALEITESLFLRDTSALAACFTALRSAGVEIALDDFGTGYSSLAYIRRFPLDKIKIDRSFVSGLPEDQESSAIIAAVVGMAQKLGYTVLAEGIETGGQAEALRTLGCDEAQGYLFGRPMPGSAIRAMLATGLGDAAAAGVRRAS